MTEDDLQAIEARANAATSQPWEACKLSEGLGYLGYVYSSGLGDVVAGSSSAAFLLDDAEFIAAARADVPALVAEVRRLRETLTGISRQRCPVCEGPEVATGTLRGEPLPKEFREVYLGDPMT